MPRSENQEDVTINSVEYLLAPGEEGYTKNFIRAMLQDQGIGGQQGQHTSRPDIRPMFQTSWAGGQRWELPLISAQNIDVYGLSEGFDMVTQPGNLYALPDIAALAGGTINDNPFALMHDPTMIYYFEDQKVSLGIVVWDGTNFTTLTNDFGEGANAIPQAMCWDAAKATIFATFNEPAVDASVRFVTPDSAGGAVISITESHVGSNLFMWGGRLMTYNGILLREITDPLGTPALVTIFDDGEGVDWLSRIVTNTIDPIIPTPWGCRLAIATAEGVYIVKNTIQDGQPTAFIYRVETTNDGQDIGTPVATLPRGLVCLNITFHLGSLVVACSPDINRISKNNISTDGHAETIFYQFNLESGLGTIGSPQGPAFGTATAITTTFRFLGSLGNLLYIGGFDRIWVYDAVRGGIHSLINNSQSATFGSWGSMAVTTDGTNEVLQFFHDDSMGLRLPRTDVAGATDTHQLDSVYFDGNLPGESKTVYAVTLMTDGILANETWTVSLAADDAAFSSVAVYDTDGDKTVRKEFSSAVTGHRFRYRLAYTCSSDVATPSIVKGIIFWMVAGEMLTQWQLRLDMTNNENIKNERFDLATKWTNLETLGALTTLVVFIDNYKPTATTHDVRVSGVKLDKANPDEGFADITLVEHNLNN